MPESADRSATRTPGIDPEHVASLCGAVLETATDATLIVDQRGTIVLANARAESLFGYARSELINKPVRALMPERYRAAHAASHDSFICAPQGRRMAPGREVFALAKNGDTLRVEITLEPIATDAGVLIATHVRDLSERERAEDKFRALLEAAPDAMVIVDQHGRIVLVNAQTEALFGFQREELIGQSIDRLVPASVRGKHAMYRSRYEASSSARPMGAGIDLRASRKDGSEFAAEISLSPVQTEQGMLVIAAVRDISERKQREELVEENLRIAQANRLKAEFLANMSHELRTPLNAILGFGELLHDEQVGSLNATQKDFLGDILTSAQHLLGLINDVLELTKVESGHLEFYPQPVDLGAIIREVKKVVRPLAAQKRLHVSLELSPELGLVTVDPLKLRQVLYNYLSNAIKFTPEHGRVVVRSAAAGSDFFRIEVQDTGVGIEADDLDKLFVEFQQLDSSIGKRHQGTGLGLALTKRIVEAQGGSVGVSSAPGSGSTFYAVLPRLHAAAPQGRA